MFGSCFRTLAVNFVSDFCWISTKTFAIERNLSEINETYRNPTKHVGVQRQLLELKQVLTVVILRRPTGKRRNRVGRTSQDVTRAVKGVTIKLRHRLQKRNTENADKRASPHSKPAFPASFLGGRVQANELGIVAHE